MKKAQSWLQLFKCNKIAALMGMGVINLQNKNLYFNRLFETNVPCFIFIKLKIRKRR